MKLRNLTAALLFFTSISAFAVSVQADIPDRLTPPYIWVPNPYHNPIWDIFPDDEVPDGVCMYGCDGHATQEECKDRAIDAWCEDQDRQCSSISVVYNDHDGGFSFPVEIPGASCSVQR